MTKNNKSHTEWYDTKMDMKLKGAQFNFENIFQGNPTLSEVTNRVINENALAAYEDLHYVIEDTLAEIVTNIVNNIYRLYSIDELFEL